MLHLYNTLSRRIEPFTPREPGKVDLFVCGPTVYDYSHAGHAKTYTQFDFIARYLARTYKVNYLLNITDVDDKLIARAKVRNLPVDNLAAEFTAAFFADMDWLSNTTFTKVAAATEYIPAIIEQIQQLQARGAAYELEDGWYFDLSTRPEYGQLSGRRTIAAGDALSRIDDNDRKRNPGDFALWKASKPGEPAWDSPFGRGRPGWHIEDTAITATVFGAQYDIHGGAVDLIFPHHEAEIAQMETAAGVSPMVRYWLHTGLLQVNGEKMAKSTGNYITIQHLAATTDAYTLRYLFLSQHYRSNAELTDKALHAAETARKRVETFFFNLGTDEEDEATRQAVERLGTAFYAALDDDLNAPAALAYLFDAIRDANREGTAYGTAMRDFLLDINTLFVAFDFSEPAASLPDEIIALVRARSKARHAGDYDGADRLRQDLLARGATVKDVPGGTEVDLPAAGARQFIA